MHMFFLIFPDKWKIPKFKNKIIKVKNKKWKQKNFVNRDDDYIYKLYTQSQQ